MKYKTFEEWRDRPGRTIEYETIYTMITPDNTTRMVNAECKKAWDAGVESVPTTIMGWEEKHFQAYERRVETLRAINEQLLADIRNKQDNLGTANNNLARSLEENDRLAQLVRGQDSEYSELSGKLNDLKIRHANLESTLAAQNGLMAKECNLNINLMSENKKLKEQLSNESIGERESVAVFNLRQQLFDSGIKINRLASDYKESFAMINSLREDLEMSKDQYERRIHDLIGAADKWRGIATNNLINSPIPAPIIFQQKDTVCGKLDRIIEILGDQGKRQFPY